MLPGMIAPMAGLGDGLRSIALVGFSVSTGATISWPAGRQVNDLAVLVDMAANTDSSYPSGVTPSGFSAITTADGNSNFLYGRVRVSRKKLVGGESGSLTGMNATMNRKILAVWRPNWDWGYGSHIGTQIRVDLETNPPSRSVNIGANQPPIIALGYKGTSNSGSLSISPGPADFESDSGSANAILFAKFMLNAGEAATQTFDCGQHGSNNILGTTLFSLT